MKQTGIGQPKRLQTQKEGAGCVDCRAFLDGVHEEVGKKKPGVVIGQGTVGFVALTLFCLTTSFSIISYQKNHH